MPKKLTQEEWIRRANLKHNSKYDYSKLKYKNAWSKVVVICHEHGEFLLEANSHIKGTGCKLCGYIESANKQSSSKEDFIKQANVIHSNKYDYSLVEYKNCKTKVKIICSEHGVFEQTPNSHINGTTSQGCPCCKESKGELKIREWLKINNIQFETQKTFNGCKGKRLLRFDFYLPDYNLCIEFDGVQHYRPFSWNYKVSKEVKINNFEEVKLKDKIKSDFCKNNGIKLLRIPYWKIKNIDKILSNYIEFTRPKSQGGTWLLANKLKIIGDL